MDLQDPKALKKLVDSCRKAGITTFKGFGVEFTVGPEPEKRHRRKAERTIEVQGPNGKERIAAYAAPKDETIHTDTPTEEELLFWSSGGGEDEATA